MEITLSENGIEVENLFYKILLAIYYIAFIWVSYGVFQEARLDHQYWILPDVFRGILGGMVLVYPFNVFTFGLDVISKWFKWFCIYTALFAITAMIGGIFGIGV